MRLWRRGKAFLVAVGMVLAIVVAERRIYADDWDALRILCAPWKSWPTVWTLLGCDALPDDPARAQG